MQHRNIDTDRLLSFVTTLYAQAEGSARLRTNLGLIKNHLEKSISDSFNPLLFIRGISQAVQSANLSVEQYKAINETLNQLFENIPLPPSSPHDAKQQAQVSAAANSVDVSTLEKWEAARNQGRWFYQRESGITKDVNTAYQGYTERDPQDVNGLLRQLEQLYKLRAAAQKWMEEKWSSQFSKNGTLRTDSRLPAMAALQKFAESEIEQARRNLQERLRVHYTQAELDDRIRGALSKIVHSWELLNESGVALNSKLQVLPKAIADNVLTALKQSIKDINAYAATRSVIKEYLATNSTMTADALITKLNVINRQTQAATQTTYDVNQLESKFNELKTTLNEVKSNGERLASLRMKILPNIKGVFTQAASSIRNSRDQEAAAVIWNERLSALSEVAIAWDRWLNKNANIINNLNDNDYNTLIGMLTHSVHRFLQYPSTRSEVHTHFAQHLQEVSRGLPNTPIASGRVITALVEPLQEFVKDFRLQNALATGREIRSKIDTSSYALMRRLNVDLAPRRGQSSSELKVSEDNLSEDDLEKMLNARNSRAEEATQPSAPSSRVQRASVSQNDQPPVEKKSERLSTIREEDEPESLTPRRRM